MYCACVWDDETESVVRWYWVSTHRRAVRLAKKYAEITGMETFVEGERSSYCLDDAIGY